MAQLRLEDGTIYTDLSAIAQELAPLNICLEYWTLGEDADLRSLLAQASLTDTQKDLVLATLNSYFEHLQQPVGYTSRDLIVLHPETPNLDALLSKFDQIHTHADDEVRYIIDGEGIFGFVRPDGSQVELTVQPGEFINVPAKTEHWFYLTSMRRIKAVRYFIGTEGWVPHYTDTAIHFRQMAGWV